MDQLESVGELVDLTIEEVSFVDQGANPDAHITLFKAAKAVEDTMAKAKPVKAVEEIVKAEEAETVIDVAEDFDLPADLVDDSHDVEKALVLKRISDLEETVKVYQRKEKRAEITDYIKARWPKVPEGALYLYEKCWDDKEAMTALQSIANLNSARYRKMVGNTAGVSTKTLSSGSKAIDRFEALVAARMAEGATKKDAILMVHKAYPQFMQELSAQV